MTQDTIQNTKCLVLGLGKTGLDSVHFLKKNCVTVSVADTNPNPSNLKELHQDYPDIPVFLGKFTQAIFANQDWVLISPGIPISDIPLPPAKMIPIIGDIELFNRYRNPQAKVIAITGSNGKSTVTSMVGDCCKLAGLRTVVAGNIGIPVLGTLAENPDVFVLEVSSFQLETTHKLEADASAVLNISPDHLDRHQTIENYVQAKQKIFAYAKTCIFNRDDPHVNQMPMQNGISFGQGLPTSFQSYGLNNVDGIYYLQYGEEILMSSNELKIDGKHNFENALACFALCRAIGLSHEIIRSSLRTFKGLPHRLEKVATIDDITFFNDSKGTNVGAMMSALAGLSDEKANIILIAGGEGKGQDFSLANDIIQRTSKSIILIGRDAKFIQSIWGKLSIPITCVESMNIAVQTAYKQAKRGDKVLLSPACASFDMFKNYEHRGESFISAVEKLPHATLS